MQDLLARTLRDRRGEAFLHPGDLAWWIGWPPKTQRELAATVTLWEDGDRLLAWTMIDVGDVAECVEPDLATAPDAWRDVDELLGSRPGLSRSVRADDEARMARLRSASYRPVEGGSMIGFSIDLTALAPTEPDAGVAPVSAGDDPRPRASVTRAAFSVDRPHDRYVEQYAAFMTSPAYPAGWDLVAWASPGEAAACTIAWPDPVSRVGNLEPVATHPDFQRRGFGTRVLREALRRLRDAGMREAIVLTPSANRAAIGLYRSVGFRDDHVQLSYRLA
jgi:ribosomal protein S18 acetylase RimI-like enzyme